MQFEEAQRKAGVTEKIPRTFEWFDTTADDFAEYELFRVEQNFLLYKSKKSGQIEAVLLPKIMFNLLIF